MNFKYFFIAAAAILIVGAVLVLRFNFLTVKEVKVNLSGVSCLSAEQLKAQTNLLAKNILLINQTEIEKSITEKYPCVASVTIIRQFPGQVDLKVLGRMPLVKLSSYTPLDLSTLESSPSSSSALLDWTFPETSASTLLVADKNGFVFSDKNTANLTNLLIPAQVKVGQFYQADLFPQLNLVLVKLATILSLNPSNLELKLDQDNLLVKNPFKIVFSLDSNVEVELASLQLILDKAKIDNRIINSVDLRFNKPVVIYAPQSKNG